LVTHAVEPNMRSKQGMLMLSMRVRVLQSWSIDASLYLNCSHSNITSNAPALRGPFKFLLTRATMLRCSQCELRKAQPQIWCAMP